MSLTIGDDYWAEDSRWPRSKRRGRHARRQLRKKRKMGNSTVVPENWFGLYGFVKRWTMHRYLLKFYKNKGKIWKAYKSLKIEFPPMSWLMASGGAFDPYRAAHHQWPIQTLWPHICKKFNHFEKNSLIVVFSLYLFFFFNIFSYFVLYTLFLYDLVMTWL